MNLAQDASPGNIMQHDLVPQGRLKVVQDCVAAYFQPSPFDKLRAGSAGPGLEMRFSHTLAGPPQRRVGVNQLVDWLKPLTSGALAQLPFPLYKGDK